MTESDTWLTLIAYKDLEPGDVTEVTLNNRRIAIYDAADGVFATQAHCSHAGAALCDGYFDGRTIECPLHQGFFDIKDGKALGAPAVKALKVYPVRVFEGQVQIRM